MDNKSEKRFTVIRWTKGGEIIHMTAVNSESFVTDYQTALGRAQEHSNNSGNTHAVVEVLTIVTKPPAVQPPLVAEPFVPKA